MRLPELTEFESNGVTLLGDTRRPGGVALAFTERTGGVSRAPYESLNLGTHVGDDPADVAENRRRALAAMGGEGLLRRLVVPRQVHGSRVCVVRDSSDAALESVRAEVAEGCDAVVCIVPGVPVMLCFADCAPVVLAAPGGFAVAHSGWRGTIAGIAGLALRALCEEAGAEPAEVLCYVGPHIAGEDYEVSDDLLGRFVAEYGDCVRAGGRHLALLPAIRASLERAGALPEMICDAGVSTPRCVDRFFSYRAEEGLCGRHGAVAFMGSDPVADKNRRVAGGDLTCRT